MARLTSRRIPEGSATPRAAVVAVPDREDIDRVLVERMRTLRPELQAMFDTMNGPWGYEDAYYRFYHHSFKVYAALDTTAAAVRLPRELLPDRPLNAAFERILGAFSCKARYFCPSRCQHAKRLALWTCWLEETPLAGDVPHRQVVRTLTREPELAVGIVACIQTHGRWLLPCQLASAHPYDCHRRRLSRGRHLRALAGARHRGVDRSLSPGGAPDVCAARGVRAGRCRRDAGLAAFRIPCP